MTTILAEMAQRERLLTGLSPFMPLAAAEKLLDQWEQRRLMRRRILVGIGIDLAEGMASCAPSSSQ